MNPQKKSEGSERNGCVVVQHNGLRSYAAECFCTYPLRLIQQQSWLSCVSFSVLGFGGGMVAGDKIHLSADVRDGGVVWYAYQQSHFFPCFRFSTTSFKTQGTNKVFKSPEGQETIQRFDGIIERDGLLALTPDPTTCYESAVFCQQQSFKIADGGSLVLVDWFTSGRNVSYITLPFLSLHISIVNPNCVRYLQKVGKQLESAMKLASNIITN